MPVSLTDRVGMWLRKVPPSKVSRALATIEEAGGTVSVKELETQYLAGGDLQACAEAMRALLEVGADADWRVVTAVDLAGVDAIAVANEAANRRVSVVEVLNERLDTEI